MRKSAFMALGVVLVAGSALASNTGFKLNYPLTFAASKTNWVSFPTFYFPNGNVSVTQQNSLDVCHDMNDFQATPGKVASVTRWQTLAGTALGQPCVSPKAIYNIVAGEAYSLAPVAANIVVNIVGSNNDAFAPNKGGVAVYPLQQVAGGSNLNWVSVPYHATADNSFDLCQQWNTQTGNKIGSVQKWISTNDTALGQPCVSPKNIYNLVPGEGYAVVPTTTGVSISWNVY